MDFSMVFHLVAAVAFIALGYFYLRLRGDVLFLSRCRRRDMVMMVRPSEFLTRICGILTVPVESSVKVEAEKYIRVHPSLWMQLLSGEWVERVILQGQADQAVHVTLKCRSLDDPTQSFVNYLVKRLNTDMRIQIVSDHQG